MIYDLRQTTIYAYASNVAYAHHVLRLTPINRTRQRVHAAALEVEPAPAERREGQDFFGNHLTWIRLDQPHDRACHQADCARHRRAALSAGASARRRLGRIVRDAAFAINDIGPKSPAHYLFPSRQVSLDPEIRDYARESFPPGRPVLEGAIDLMQRIKADFVYEIGATTVTTTPPMSFALRRGVCQDFAHIMISGLRGLGLPAAYVSGYLRTTVGPVNERLVGADAMHAWVLVWCGPEAGWYGLDPTNSLLAGDDHIVLAVGRDYADVAPIDGVVVAFGGQRLGVAVSVTPIGSAYLPRHA